MERNHVRKEDLDLETFINNSHYVVFDEYSEGKVASFGQLGQIEQGLSDSKSHVPTPRSDLENISLPVKTGAIELVQDS